VNQQTTTRGVARPAAIPTHDPEWHPIATQLYLATQDSGQADFYQSSDWALLWSICDDLSYYKSSSKRSGQMLQTIYSAFERLLVAEGDRRRVRIELELPPADNEEKAGVVAIDGYKSRLAAGPAKRE
jgi:hypothetical protein